MIMILLSKSYLFDNNLILIYRSSDYENISYLKRKRSKRKKFLEDDNSNLEDSSYYTDNTRQNQNKIDNSLIYQSDETNQIKSLKRQLKSVTTQVKTLKRMFAMTIFGGKKQMRNFFNDIW